MKKLSLASLVILIIAAIDNIRNLPMAALCGSSLIFFFLSAAVLFLLPAAFISAELSSLFPDKGGIYAWVQRAFGPKWAMLAIWLQWINTMIWYPSILFFIAATGAYLIDPNLAQNKGYLIPFVLTVFWGLTWVNLKGIHVSARVNNICGLFGTMFPMLVLIVLGIIWVCSGHPLQIHFTDGSWMPSFNQSGTWGSLIAIMAAFLGMELSGVHVNEIDQPQKNFPKAVLIATLVIFLSMVFGALSIAFVLPQQEIQIVSGIMQVLENLLSAFHLQALTPVFTILITVGSIGTMINWLISPAKGLLHAAEFGFLPPFFQHKNKAGVASRIMIAQALLVSLLTLLLLLEPSVNGLYWFFTALSTGLYMLMYILMFSSALRLHYTHKDRALSFKIPGKAFGIWILALSGLLGALLTIAISFFPPDTVDIGSPKKYLYMIGLGNLIAISPIFILFLYAKRKKSTPIEIN